MGVTFSTDPTTSCTYDPMQLVGLPIGMFHCPRCGAMCVAGCPHPSDESCRWMDDMWTVPEDGDDVEAR